MRRSLPKAPALTGVVLAATILLDAGENTARSRWRCEEWWLSTY